MRIVLFVILTVSAWITDGVTSKCDDGWVSGLGHCYLFVNTTKLDWHHASAACRGNNSELAYFDTMDELKWFRTVLANHWSYAYWTGLNIPPLDFGLLVRNRQWTWGFYRAVDTKLLNSNEFWNMSPTQPIKSLCMGINIQGHFEDLDCDSKQQYACSIQWGGDGSCPLGWFVTDRGCLLFSHVDDPLLTWSQAKDKCWKLDQSDGAHLLSLTNVEDAAFIKRLLPNLNATTHVFWTGLVTKGNNFVWDSGAHYDPQFVGWAVEPDHVAGQETCGAVRFSGYFSDRDCSEPLNYVCKR